MASYSFSREPKEVKIIRTKNREIKTKILLSAIAQLQEKSALNADEQNKIIEKLSKTQGLDGLNEACNYKIQQLGWTNFLSELSKRNIPFHSKTFKVIKELRQFSKVSISRQTLGALKAFLLNSEI